MDPGCEKIDLEILIISIESILCPVTYHVFWLVLRHKIHGHM